jgi:hypothetical protein
VGGIGLVFGAFAMLFGIEESAQIENRNRLAVDDQKLCVMFSSLMRDSFLVQAPSRWHLPANVPSPRSLASGSGIDTRPWEPAFARVPCEPFTPFRRPWVRASFQAGVFAAFQ